MTPNRFSTAPVLPNRSRLAPPIQPRRLAPALGLVLLASAAASLALGCGGESDRMGSTDTGNPPVIVSQKLHITPAPSGVTVSGDAGAVTAGARVDVVNTSTGDSAGTTAADDGSFAVGIEGGVDDEYRVYAELAGQTTRADVNAAGGSGSEVGLAGLDFLLQSAQGDTPLENTSVTLSFDARDVSLRAACNNLFGQYTLCDDRLCVQDLSTTDIGCDAARHAQDEWLGDFLTASPLVNQTGPSLTLTGAMATLQFLDSEVADPDRPLAGPTWVIDTLIDGGSSSSVAVEPVPNVEFRTDGTVRVSSSCNTGEGTYTSSAGSLELSDVAYSEEGCNIEANQAVAQHIQQILQDGTLSFEIDQNRLTLQRGTLGLGALASE
jgi:heat shock protein HslJ